MSVSFSKAAASPTAAGTDLPPAVWIWHGLDRAGRWLPEALLRAVGHAEPVIDPFSVAGDHRATLGARPTNPPTGAADKRVGALLNGVRALSQAVDDCEPGVLGSMLQAADARQVRHLIVCLSGSASRLADRLANWPAQPPVTALVQRDRSISYQLGLIQQTLAHAGVPVRRLELDLLASAASDALDWPAFWASVGLANEPGTTAALTARWRTRLRAEIEANAAALDVPWRELIEREALWSAGPELPPAALTPVIHSTAGPGRPIRLVKIDRLPNLLLEGDPVRLAGAVVPMAKPSEDGRLRVCQGSRFEEAGWGQASPGIAARLPDLPHAAQARFSAITIHALRRRPASLECRPQAAAAPMLAAEVAFEPMGREPIEGIFLAPWSIGYQPIPKSACTSIKEMLFQMTVGQPFSSSLAGGARHVHNYFTQRHRDVSAAGFRFIVVRDPIKRFLSAYSSRVLRHKELSREKIERLPIEPSIDLDDFPFDPDLQTFVERYDLYRRIPTIAHHCRPISEFCAPLDAFDKVYPFERLGELVSDLRRMTGRAIELPHSQRSSRIPIEQISPRIFDKLAELYAADYEMLAGLYSPAALH
jgi:hypothetical protein